MKKLVVLLGLTTANLLSGMRADSEDGLGQGVIGTMHTTYRRSSC